MGKREEAPLCLASRRGSTLRLTTRSFQRLRWRLCYAANAFPSRRDRSTVLTSRGALFELRR
jgi:hypothetical protein